MKAGYYWINVPDQGGWQIAETRDGLWWELCGSDVSCRVGDSWSGVEEIGDRIPDHPNATP